VDLARVRLIDRLIGGVLCAVLDASRRILGRREESTGSSPKKILFIELSEIGAAILAEPALRHVRRSWPEAEIYFWIFAENADVLRVQGLVDPEKVFLIRSRSVWTVMVDALAGLRRVRREGIDAVVDLELFSRITAILSFLTGASQRTGFDRHEMEGLYRGKLQTRAVLYNPYRHISANFIALVEALKRPADEAPHLKAPSAIIETSVPRAPGLDSYRDAMSARLSARLPGFDRRKGFICLHADFESRLPIRNWPMPRYRELADRLLALDGVFVAWVGKIRGDGNGTPAHARSVDLSGETTLEELLGTLDLATAVVSHDSGVVHPATLTRAAVVALYGPETPSLYGPLTEDKTVFYENFACSPCLSAFNHRTSTCRDNACVRAIGVDAVFEAVRKRLY